MQKFIGTAIGKSVRLTTAFRKNGGQALPGLVVERLLPNYTQAMLKNLPEGVVLVTGTNGKTTTTKIVVELLQANGKRVLTNSTGSNMTRGIASGLIKNAKLSGKLPFDIAILEVDEAYLKPLVSKIKPRWILALNVSRDQLDRFGEVDTVADLIGAAMGEATDGVIVNADDPQLVRVAGNSKASTKYFSVASGLYKFFPSDYELAAVKPNSGLKKAVSSKPSEVELAAFSGQEVTYKVGGKAYQARLALKGQHNFQNAAAALALTKQLLPETAVADLVSELAGISIAFGRGESYHLGKGNNIELVLVKNPAAFRQALTSYASQGNELTIAINDNIADGRDVSWLWDVSFKSLAGRTVALTSGSRAADMALRLSYDDIKFTGIEPDLDQALKLVSARAGNKTIFATYTAMTYLHTKLTKLAEKAR